MTERFRKLFEQAQYGYGSDWISAEELVPFCQYILGRGRGVHLMEAVPTENSLQRRNHGYEILGVEGEESWENHRDPVRSIALVHEKLKWAKDDGGEFVYKVWVDKP